MFRVRSRQMKKVRAKQCGKTAETFEISKLKMQISPKVLMLSKKQAQIRIPQEKLQQNDDIYHMKSKNHLIITNAGKSGSNGQCAPAMYILKCIQKLFEIF